MRKERQKGFTVVELLAVLVILAVLAIIAIPTVRSIIKTTQERYYKTLEDQLRLMAIDYYDDHRSERPKYNLSTNQVDLKTLIEGHYTNKEVVDASGNATCANSYVRVLKESEGKYEYTTCLVCKDYKSDKEYCNGEYHPDQNDHIYTLEVPDKVKSYINNPIDVSRLTKATLKARGREVSKVTASAASVSGVDVSKSYTYPDQVAYQVLLENGTTLEAKTTDLEIYQNEAPTVTLTKAATDQYDDQNYKESYTQDTWTNRNVKESLEVKENYPDEFSAIQVFNEETNTWESYCNKMNCTFSNRVQLGKVYEKDVTIRGIDKKGNVSKTKTYHIKIDKVPPECPSVTTVDQKKGYPIELKVTPALDSQKWLWYVNDNGKTGQNAVWRLDGTFQGTSAQNVKFSLEGDRQGKMTVSDVAGNSRDCFTQVYNINYCDSTFQDVGAWSNCSKTCGGGTRTRTITIKANYNNKVCDSKTESQNCNTSACTPKVQLTGNINKWVCGHCRSECDAWAAKVNNTCPDNVKGNTVGHVSGTVKDGTVTFEWTVVQGQETYIATGYWVKFIIKDSSGKEIHSEYLKTASGAKWAKGSTNSGSITYTFTTAGTYHIYIEGNSTNPQFDMDFGTIKVS